MLAEQWGIPPWVIEAEASILWVERWEALQEARNQKQKTGSSETRVGDVIKRTTVL